MEPTIDLANYYLGRIYLLQGRKARACEAFKLSKDAGEREGTEAYFEVCQ
jgi:hypothetical protein